MTGQLSLPDDITAARVARRAVREALSAESLERHGDEFVDDAELVASELVANAVSHGEPPFKLAIDVKPDRVRVAVTNSGAHGEPHVEAAGTESGRGRGLAMVSALSDDWGWHRDGDSITVWAEIAAR